MEELPLVRFRGIGGGAGSQVEARLQVLSTQQQLATALGQTLTLQRGAEARPGLQLFPLRHSSWLSAHIQVFLAYFWQLTLPVQLRSVAPFPRVLDFTQVDRALCTVMSLLTFGCQNPLAAVAFNVCWPHVHRNSSLEFTGIS